MGRRKNKFLLIDVETCNGKGFALPYDIGYVICDSKGETDCEKSFIVRETFCQRYDELITSPYYRKKLPKYWEGIKKGERVLESIFSIRKQILLDMSEFGVKAVIAYNAIFDKKALNNIIYHYSERKIRDFFPNADFYCLWHMACQVLMARPTFVKFATKNLFINEKGNLLTSAEVCYRYITGNIDFVEEHTGLEDAKIEREILVKCFAQHKRMNKRINSSCWKLPQKKKKEMFNS